MKIKMFISINFEVKKIKIAQKFALYFKNWLNEDEIAPLFFSIGGIKRYFSNKNYT